MTLVAGPGDPGAVSLFANRRQLWFDDPDGAYLVMAAIRRDLDATNVSDFVLVPTDHGPALELPSAAVSLRLVQALIRRFDGHIGRAGPDAHIPAKML